MKYILIVSFVLLSACAYAQNDFVAIPRNQQNSICRFGGEVFSFDSGVTIHMRHKSHYLPIGNPNRIRYLMGKSTLDTLIVGTETSNIKQRVYFKKTESEFRYLYTLTNE